MLWEASDRICGKLFKVLLPVLLESRERHGHTCNWKRRCGNSYSRSVPPPLIASYAQFGRRLVLVARRAATRTACANWCRCAHLQIGRGGVGLYGDGPGRALRR